MTGMEPIEVMGDSVKYLRMHPVKDDPKRAFSFNTFTSALKQYAGLMGPLPDHVLQDAAALRSLGESAVDRAIHAAVIDALDGEQDVQVVNRRFYETRVMTLKRALRRVARYSDVHYLYKDDGTYLVPDSAFQVFQKGKAQIEVSNDTLDFAKNVALIRATVRAVAAVFEPESVVLVRRKK